MKTFYKPYKTYKVKFKVDGNDNWFSFMPVRALDKNYAAEKVRNYYKEEIITDMVIEEV